MKKYSEMTMEELAAYICDKLYETDVHVVLSGGGCVQVYTDNAYMSADIDLVDRYSEPKKIDSVMKSLGFTQDKSKYYTHPECSFFIEFPRGPLAVGDDMVEKIAELKTSSGILRLLTPIDCIKDRLSAYFHWKDIQALEQASWVAKQQADKIDFVELDRWAVTGANSGQDEKYSEFKKLI
jgi:hypothetical protein